MDGRQVFERPESPASAVMQRAVIQGSEEAAALSETFVAAALARRAMTPQDLADELVWFRALESERAAGSNCFPVDKSNEAE